MTSAKRCVVTLGDYRFKPIMDQTLPMTRRYADRIGADFHLIENRNYPGVHIPTRSSRCDPCLTGTNAFYTWTGMC